MILRVLTVFGTRPEAIKLAPVIQKLKAEGSKIKTIVCVTAQHREMLDEVLRTFNIKQDYDLDIMESNQSLFEVTAKGLLGIREILELEKPDVVLLQGDTTTTFAVALAAFYLKIPIGHIEAGLRTKDKYKPFPEEINRRLTSALTDFHFAPTESAKMNLLREGFDGKNIFITGNTVVDALFWILNNTKRTQKQMSFEYPFLNSDNRLILVTAHRRESFGEPLENICEALRKIVERNKNVKIVYPVHLNPNVQMPVKRILSNIDRIYLISPLNYESFVHFMNKSFFILTDSGGIQEEAPSLDKPVLVMRDRTERPEAIEAGTARLVGTETGKIIENVERLLNDKTEYQRMAKATNLFGDGKAAERIVKILLRECEMCRGSI